MKIPYIPEQLSWICWNHSFPRVPSTCGEYSTLVVPATTHSYGDWNKNLLDHLKRTIQLFESRTSVSGRTFSQLILFYWLEINFLDVFQLARWRMLLPLMCFQIFQRINKSYFIHGEICNEYKHLNNWTASCRLLMKECNFEQSFSRKDVYHRT